MRFQVLEVDQFMWPGKYGIVGADGEEEAFSLDDWRHSIARSVRIVTVPSGRKSERSTFIFASAHDLGRVELVYQHGHIWPVNPPPAGRAIMDELVEHLNDVGENGEPGGRPNASEPRRESGTPPQA